MMRAIDHDLDIQLGLLALVAVHADTPEQYAEALSGVLALAVTNDAEQRYLRRWHAWQRFIAAGGQRRRPVQFSTN